MTEATYLWDNSTEVIAISAPGGKKIVRLAIVDGHMTAQYDPADLDQAAQQFWQAIASMYPGAMPALTVPLGEMTANEEREATCAAEGHREVALTALGAPVLAFRCLRCGATREQPRDEPCVSLGARVLAWAQEQGIPLTEWQKRVVLIQFDGKEAA